MVKRHDTEVDEVKAASKRGAKEDIMYVSLFDEGYDLRYGNNNNLKQKIDENDNS
jgi:hypothetical protein